MKKKVSLIVAILFVVSTSFSQGTILYDQQSSTDEGTPSYGQGSLISNISPPWGQSFLPSLSSVSFIRLTLDDNTPADGLGASMFINLRSDSITGPIIATTASVDMPNGFRAGATFNFALPVRLTPGIPYYFEPVLTTTSPWNILSGSYNYPNGTAFEAGIPSPGSDLWFREGIIVPEPASAAILLLGSLLFAVPRRPVK